MVDRVTDEMLKNALTDEEYKFYKNARILYNDSTTWRKILMLQDKAVNNGQ